MSKDAIVLWRPKLPVKIPPTLHDAKDIVPFANSHQLTARDRMQIISAFENNHYEMACSFVWTKALSSLKAQLGKLGAAFIRNVGPPRY